MSAIKQTIPGNWDYQDEETIADVSSSLTDINGMIHAQESDG